MMNRLALNRPAPVNTLPLLFSLVLLFGCASRERKPESVAASQPASSTLSGTIEVDGSSTVHPITEAMAEEFSRVNPGVRVTVGVSGTGGGFEKFLARETDINSASRPIKPAEAALAKERGIEFIELPVAYDGIVVAVHPAAGFVDHLTIDELRKIWEPGSKVARWSDIRHGWPAQELRLYGPGPDSGTFDYFTEVVVGKASACRADYTASEDDSMLIRGIAGDEGALGYFGFAHLAANPGRMRAVPIRHRTGAVAPSREAIESGLYTPLSRPVFLYLSVAAMKRPEVAAFAGFYLEQAAALAPEVGFVPLPEAVRRLSRLRLQRPVTGTLFADAPVTGRSLVDLLESAAGT